MTRPEWCALLTAIGCLLGTAGLAVGQSPLPVIEEVDAKPLREQCRRLLQALEGQSSPLSAENVKELQSLLKDGGDPEKAGARIQALLDAHCLIGVHINPESRVKAARGPAPAELQHSRPVVFLVKVHNEAGVTHGLTVSGPQLRTGAKAEAGHWLEAAVQTDRPLRKTLTGQKLDYVVVRFTAHEAGKREATLQFDVGQGTQDLGFRAEVPVLFVIRPAGK